MTNIKVLIEKTELDMRKGSISIVLLSLSWTFSFSQNFPDLPIYDDFYEDSREVITDIDDEMDIEPRVQKRFDSFFNQRAREKYLFKKTPSVGMEQESSKVKRKSSLILKMSYFNNSFFRNRETTLTELIKLCRNTGESTTDDDIHFMEDSDIYFRAPAYGKRFGSSLMNQQARTRAFLKSVSINKITEVSINKNTEEINFFVDKW